MKKNHVRVLTVMTVIALVQLSCGTKVVSEALCWNTGGMWLCDDEDCNTGHCQRPESAKEVGESDDPLKEEREACWDSGGQWFWDDELDENGELTGHCGPRTYLTNEERECVTNGDIWIWDDEKNLIGHCETLDFLDKYSTEVPVQEEQPSVDDEATEAPVQENPETGVTVQVGDPIDECDARDAVIIGHYLNRDAHDPKGNRWCEEELTIFNPSNTKVVFIKHSTIHDWRDPAAGPMWSDINALSPDGFRKQLGYFHENFDIGVTNYFYMDQLAVAYLSCFEDYSEWWDIPVEYLEPYAFDVPYQCSP